MKKNNPPALPNSGGGTKKIPTTLDNLILSY